MSQMRCLLGVKYLFKFNALYIFLLNIDHSFLAHYFAGLYRRGCNKNIVDRVFKLLVTLTTFIRAKN
jgi:hypothetical protein